MDSLQQQIPFIGNIFENKCCRYNEGPLCMRNLARIVVTFYLYDLNYLINL